jgi:WD40 repeat protein
MQTLAAYKRKVRAISFSADGAYLASGGAAGSAVSLWHLASGRRRKLPAMGNGLLTLAFAPTGPALGVLYNWYHARVWPDPAGDGEHYITPGGGPLAFRPDGEVFAMVHYDLSYHRAELRFWTLAKEQVAAVQLPEFVQLRTWSPTGPVLAGIRGNLPGNIGATHVDLIHPDRVPAVTNLTTMTGHCTDLAFSPDGSTLAVATGERIQRWELELPSVLPALKGHDRMVNSIRYLPDGRLLSCSNDGTVRTWDGDRCVDVKDWQLGELTTLAVARDGMRAAVGSKSGTILIWDID